MNITIDQMIEALTEMKLKETGETPKVGAGVAGDSEQFLSDLNEGISYLKDYYMLSQWDKNVRILEGPEKLKALVDRLMVYEKELKKAPRCEKLLHVKLAGAYWEDAEVNGVREVEDFHQIKMPGQKCGTLDWDIDPKTGKIQNWPEGMTARTWYKVCDTFSYDYDGFHYGPTYVPDFMSLDEEGYGDYVYLSIGPDGRIRNWSEEMFLKEHARLVDESRG